MPSGPKGCPSAVANGRLEGEAFPCATAALDAWHGMGDGETLGDVEGPHGLRVFFEGPTASGETLADLKASGDLDPCEPCAAALLAATGGACLAVSSSGFLSATLYPTAEAFRADLATAEAEEAEAGETDPEA